MAGRVEEKWLNYDIVIPLRKERIGLARLISVCTCLISIRPPQEGISSFNEFSDDFHLHDLMYLSAVFSIEHMFCRLRIISVPVPCSSHFLLEFVFSFSQDKANRLGVD